MADIPDTDTGNQTSDNQERHGCSRDLKDNTNGKDTATSDDSSTTTDPIGESTGEDSTEESTSRQDGNSEGGVRSGVVETSRMFGEVIGPLTEVFDEVVGTKNSVDVPRVVTGARSGYGLGGFDTVPVLLTRTEYQQRQRKHT